MKDMLILTTNDAPGYRVVEVYGEVFGLTTRSRNVFSSTGQQLKRLSEEKLPAIRNFSMKRVRVLLNVLQKKHEIKVLMQFSLCVLTHRHLVMLTQLLLTVQLLNWKNYKKQT